MELWYSEFHTGNVKLSVRINRQLFSGESEFQRIDVFESEEFGRFVALDGEIVFSDKDEFIYDEMVTHVPMTVHPNVKNVLIIGGGRGLALSPPFFDGADGAQHPCHLQYFPSGKPGTQLGPLQGAGAVLYAAQPRCPVPGG